MNPIELAARLIKGEDLHTEFKERLIHADDLAASIIAFANTDGGRMIFGVNDEREITGLGDEKMCISRTESVPFFVQYWLQISALWYFELHALFHSSGGPGHGK